MPQGIGYGPTPDPRVALLAALQAAQQQGQPGVLPIPQAPVAPQAPGLLPQMPQWPIFNAAPPTPTGGSSLRDRVDRLLGVPGGGLLSDAERADMRRSTIQGLGTSLLQLSGPQAVQPGFLSNLGTALERSRGMAMNDREFQEILAQRQAAQQARLMQQNILQETGGDLGQAVTALTQAGDLEGAKAISEIVENVSGPEGATKLLTGIGPNGPDQFLVKNDGKVVPLGIPPIPGADGQQTKLVTLHAPGGSSEYAVWDPSTRQFTRTGEFEASPPSEHERKAAFFVPMLPSGEEAIQAFVGAPTRLAQAATALGLREFTTTEEQSLDTGGRIFAEAFLRLTSGAAITDAEVKNNSRMFRPLPGDTAATIELKRRLRNSVLQSILSASGRAALGRQGPMVDLDLFPEFQELQATVKRGDEATNIQRALDDINRLKP